MLPRDRGGRKPQAGLAAIGVVLTINGALFLLSGSAPVLAVQGATGQLVRTISEPVAVIGRGAASVRDLFVDIRSLQARLTLLLEERDQLAAEAARIASLEREVAELQATLDLRATTSFATVAAQVVARDFAIDRRYVILDVGGADGVKVGDVVIGAGASLAGRVVQVSDQSCQVRLLTDPEFSVTSEVASTGAIGQVRGRAANPLAFDDVDAQRQVPVGAEITTSGIELSPTLRSAFPRGLSVGRVVAVNSVASAVLQSADVQPTLDLDSVRTLLVILNYRGGLPDLIEAP
ncbi:rod shape-determining protein MreC [bacterium]|jgi:rod shape-determining protein MreC|nr:rod shape-determining protein MreC [bacterium]